MGNRRSLVYLGFLFLAQCAWLGVTPERRSQGPAVRDVPYQARPSLTSGLRKRVLVLPFVDVNITRSKKITQLARRAVVQQILATRRYIVIRNSDLPHDPSRYLNEKREYDMEKIATLAHNMGVAAVVEGRILKVKTKRISDPVGLIREIRAQVESTVQIKVVAARNGHVLMDHTRNGVLEDSVTQVAKYSFSDRYLEKDERLVSQAVSQAFLATLPGLIRSIEKLGWEGRVALISGERVFVNAGRVSGLQVGDLLKVLEEGEEVYDPETGQFIGNAPGRMKGTIEVVSYFGRDGSIGIVHSGSGFKENDRVELY